jgi:hypothetical protein
MWADVTIEEPQLQSVQRHAPITLVLTVLGSVDIWLPAGFGGIVGS